jgi:hypothetical protein
MDVDLDAAIEFLAGHARLLDRRRLDHLLGRCGPDGVVAALDAYRNADGGYGWALEPDLRSPESQPVAAMVALGVFADVAPSAPQCVALCDWLATVSLPDGGLPFTVPITEPAGCAPWWQGADTTTSSLQMTTQVVANAHRVAAHNPHVERHPWLDRATTWCLEAIDAIDRGPNAHELIFTLRFVDAIADRNLITADLLERIRRWIPDGGVVTVEDGIEGEVLRPLDLAPRPTGAARELFSDHLIATDLDRLVADQEPDGGWTVPFRSATPMASLEWRGDATLRAITVLTEHGALARGA